MDKLRETKDKVIAFLKDHKKQSIIPAVLVCVLVVGAVVGVSALSGGNDNDNNVVASVDDSAKKDGEKELVDKEEENTEDETEKEEATTEAEETDAAATDAAAETTETQTADTASQTTSQPAQSESTSQSSSSSNNSSKSTSSSNSGNSTSSSGSTSNPGNSDSSSSSSSSNSGSTSKPAEPTTQPSEPTEPAQPVHQHNWVQHYTTQTTDEVFHYEEVKKYVCNNCGQQFDNVDDAGRHCVTDFWDNCENYTYKVVSSHKVVDKPAETVKIPDYQYCTGCPARQ